MDDNFGTDIIINAKKMNIIIVADGIKKIVKKWTGRRTDILVYSFFQKKQGIMHSNAIIRASPAVS